MLRTAGDGIKCYNCGDRGHKSTECWTKPENKHKQPVGWKRKKETANSLIDILVVGIEVEVNDNDGGLKCKSTTHDCVKNAYHDGGLKCKSTTHDCMKNTYHDGGLKSKFTNDQAVLRVATRGRSGTTMKETMINNEKADTIFSGKSYGTHTMMKTMITIATTN